MKYIVLLGDGMADIADENKNTPLTLAQKPNMDFLSFRGELGLVKTVADGLTPGSDVANLSVLGYNPSKYYTGRSPLEAASIGVEMGSQDIAIRCNLVTLSTEKDFKKRRMIDYSADEISTDEAKILIDYLNESLISNYEGLELYSGTSYRHCLIVKNNNVGTKLHAPHDFSGNIISKYLPQGVNGDLFLELTEKACVLLDAHPLNLNRAKKGKNPANGVWFWGEGTKPKLDSFSERFGLNGAMISAVDLLKGIAKQIGFKVYENKEFTGNLSTNFELKARTALEALKEVDFVYIHVEAPDECGHRGELENKIKAIELLDSRVLAPLLDGLKKENFDYSILIMPDHATPVKLGIHTNAAVPYIIYRNNLQARSGLPYTEADAAKTNILIKNGHKLIERFILN